MGAATMRQPCPLCPSSDGGTREFSCAIKAMKVCLQKAKMQDAKNIKDDVDAIEDMDSDVEFDGSSYFIPGMNEFIKQQQTYQ